MGTKINPPNLTSVPYELYKQKLLAWREVTDLSKEKQVVAIALSLPEEDKNKIQEKVFNQIGLDQLKRDDGLDILIQFLDSILLKDELSDSFEKFQEFEEFQRAIEQSISEYISTFDSMYRKIEKLDMKLPSHILAFKLLRKANISKEENMLILTGMNYGNKGTLYDEAKASLKKSKGDITGGNLSAGIKLEPTFLAENEEALLAAGYVKQNQARKVTKWGKSGGYNNCGGGRRTQGQDFRRKMNPVGSDGQTLICKACGSYRHLMAECPDSWENMRRGNVVEEENVVLFTGYNKQEIQQLGVDARNCAVLDSACSSTVCGENWLDSYIHSLDECDRKKVRQTAGEKIFKFGGGTRLKSKGEYHLPATFAGKNVTVITDVVESDIPLLLSRNAMKRAG